MTYKQKDMSITKYVNRLQQIDNLIRQRATGNSWEFARKVGICRSVLMSNLEEIKSFGAPISYDRINKTYKYDYDYKLIIKIPS